MDRSLASSDQEKSTSPVRYAVILKTYVWNAFVERQARRCMANMAGGDFYLLVDETNEAMPSIPFDRVVRTSNAALIERGFANRFEKGSLIWWNADYPHYHFFDLHPDYAFYVFLEYDALYMGQFDLLVQRLASGGVDLAVQLLDQPKETWSWTEPHLGTYTLKEIEGCLMSICAFSRQAIAALGRRRLEMKADPGVSFWPSAEAFLPTEAKRAGLNCVSLSHFGDAKHLRWRPARLEAEVMETSGGGFFHPVYDQQRYVHWALAQGVTPRNYMHRNGPVIPHLLRLSPRTYLPALIAAWSNSVSSSIRARFRTKTLLSRSPN